MFITIFTIFEQYFTLLQGQFGKYFQIDNLNFIQHIPNFYLDISLSLNFYTFKMQNHTNLTHILYNLNAINIINISGLQNGIIFIKFLFLLILVLIFVNFFVNYKFYRPVVCHHYSSYLVFFCFYKRCCG